MNKILASILFIAFIVQAFQRNLLILDYYTDTKSFSQFCENKFRPQLHCNGKCILMKKLSEKNKEEQQNTEQKKNQSEVLFSESYFSQLLYSQTFSIYKFYNRDENIRNYYQGNVFRPPIAVSLS